MYFDYLNQKQRLDFSYFGQTMMDISRYDLGYEYQIAGGQCTGSQLQNEMFPMTIPPFAEYEGTGVVIIFFRYLII
jgi:hypothetical protein